MENKIFVHTDGGARGNPGPAGIGVIITSENHKILAKFCRKIGQSTNNIAEYKAVIEALEWLSKNMQICKYANMQITFFLDSKLVVNQLNGIFRIKDPELRNLLTEIRILEQEVGGEITYHLIPREKNREADSLVNQALDSA